MRFNARVIRKTCLTPRNRGISSSTTRMICPSKSSPRREVIYFRHFLDDRNIFSDADAARYGKSYAGPENLRAILEIYWAFAANEKFSAAQRSTISQQEASI